MSAAGESLASRIRGEVEDLERVRERAVRSWAGFRGGAADTAPAFLDSVAFNLHGLYSGLERLLELVARSFDGGAPAGESWHRELLRQVAQELPGVRPAVVSPESAGALEELRRFRHVARNVYATNLVPDRVGRLVETLERAWPALRRELLAFADFLDSLGDDP